MRNATAEFYFFIHGLGAWPLASTPSLFCPPLSKSVGSVVSSPSWVRGRARPQKHFGIFEAHRTAHKKLNFS